MNTEELITRYLLNETTAEENQQLLEWVVSSELHKQEFQKTCAAWHACAQASSVIDSKQAYKDFTLKTRPPLALWKAWSAVAAVALVAIALFYMFAPTTAQVQMAVIENTDSTHYSLLLPDGSAIVLAPHARIEYPEEFSSSTRDVRAAGKIFCSIAPNAEQPFVLHHTLATIKIVGTSFEVSETSVVVESGHVIVEHDSGSANLLAGQRIDKTGDKYVQSANKDANYLSWKTGVLSFNSSALSSVFADIERHYNCTISADSCTLLNEQLTATFENQPLEVVINTLQEVFPNLHIQQLGLATYAIQ